MKIDPLEQALITARSFANTDLGNSIIITLDPEKLNAEATPDGKSIVLGGRLIQHFLNDAQELYTSIIDTIGEWLEKKLTIDDIFYTTIELITAHEVGHILRKHPPTRLAWLEFTDELAQSLYNQYVEKQELDPRYRDYFIRQARCGLSKQIREIDADTTAIKNLAEKRSRPFLLCAVMLNRYTSEKIATEIERSSPPHTPQWFFPQYHLDHPSDDIRLFSEIQELTTNQPLTGAEQEVIKLIERNAENGEHRFILCCSEILNEEHRDLYEKLHECWKSMDSYIEENISRL